MTTAPSTSTHAHKDGATLASHGQSDIESMETTRAECTNSMEEDFICSGSPSSKGILQMDGEFGEQLSADSIASKLSPLSAGCGNRTTSERELSQPDHYQQGIDNTGTVSHTQERATPVILSTSYPSTVVTMTNNMATICQHGSLTANDSSQRELIKLIKNVIDGEKQITSTISSVSASAESCDGTEKLEFPSSRLNLDLLDVQQDGMCQSSQSHRLHHITLIILTLISCL